MNQDHAERIVNRLRDAYERQWQAGTPPHPRDYLDQVTEELRPRLRDWYERRIVALREQFDARQGLD